jgi:tetratricopeptide (TPR) repeat protein
MNGVLHVISTSHQNCFAREAKMKQRLGLLVPVLISLIFLWSIPFALADVTGTVKGVCKDVDGKPIVGAIVEWVNSETGRKYELKTNDKGEYFTLGVIPGRYKVTLSKDGRQLYYFNGVIVQGDEVAVDFDMQKEMGAAAQAAGATAQQAKQQQDQQAKIAKENNTIKALNEKLSTAKQDADVGNLDGAVSTMTEATQMDPNRDLLWAKLGEYTLAAAGKQTDNAEKTKRYTDAADDYTKAVDLRQKAMDTDPKAKTPDATKILAQYYNNLGQAQAKLGKTDAAVKAYNQAAQLDPAGAGQYYFNLGAILTNANISNDPKMRQAAAEAFDKAIAADPTRADAYYWKGTNLIGAATLQGDKMVAPPGTAEAFQKYLELQPTGPHAEEAKAMLTSLGSTIETNYGTKKGKPVKKPN